MFDKSVVYKGVVIKKRYVSGICVEDSPDGSARLTVFLGAGGGMSVSNTWSDLDAGFTIRDMLNLAIDIVGRRDTIRMVKSLKKEDWLQYVQ